MQLIKRKKKTKNEMNARIIKDNIYMNDCTNKNRNQHSIYTHGIHRTKGSESNSFATI